MSASVTIIVIKPNFTYEITDEELIKDYNAEDDQLELVRWEIKTAIESLKNEGIYQRHGYSPVFWAVRNIVKNNTVKSFDVAEWSDLIININHITKD